MAGRLIPAVSQTITGVSSTGSITVASTAGFYERAFAYLRQPSTFVKAELALASQAAGALDTVVRAKLAGANGNNIRVRAVGDSGAGVTITESGLDVTIHFQSGVSTVANVEAAITASSALIEVKTAGTGATVLSSPADAFGFASLAGGGDALGATVKITKVASGTVLFIHREVDPRGNAIGVSGIAADSDYRNYDATVFNGGTISMPDQLVYNPNDAPLT